MKATRIILGVITFTVCANTVYAETHNQLDLTLEALKYNNELSAQQAEGLEKYYGKTEPTADSIEKTANTILEQYQESYKEQRKNSSGKAGNIDPVEELIGPPRSISFYKNGSLGGEIYALQIKLTAKYRETHPLPPNFENLSYSEKRAILDAEREKAKEAASPAEKDQLKRMQEKDMAMRRPYPS